MGHMFVSLFFPPMTSSLILLDNIDYDDIKHLIKEHTTPGSGKAVAIPGQGNQNDSEFEDHLFAVLAQEHRRIDLFVKSKTGEIERRLSECMAQRSCRLFPNC